MSLPIKVAIIEDDPCNQKYLEMLIEKMEYQAIKLYNPSSAIVDLVRENPHVVLLDIKLSPEISGTEIAQSMKKHDSLKNIPIIVVSAFALKDEVREIMVKTQCNDYITKPFLMDRLMDSINEQLYNFYGN
jgi:DNA-binding response OmpR family regulator